MAKGIFGRDRDDEDDEKPLPSKAKGAAPKDPDTFEKIAEQAIAHLRPYRTHEANALAARLATLQGD